MTRGVERRMSSAEEQNNGFAPTLGRSNALTLPCRCLAFTLIELMIVIAIMAIVMTIGVPIVYRIWHQEPLRRAVNDIFNVCATARAEAILHDKMTEVVFHPRERRLEVSGAGSSASANSAAGGLAANPSVPADSEYSAQLADSVSIEDLDINKIPGGFRDAESARVRFFPNGTCDELSFIIRYENEWRQIKLEVSTGLATTEVDPHKFH